MKQNRYDLSGTFGIGYTHKNEPFWFDLEDYDKIKNYCWRYHRSGYVVTNIRGSDGKQKTIALHTMIMNPPENMKVDHITHEPDHTISGIRTHKIDNRKCNLRLASQKENCHNKALRKDNTSGHVGVIRKNNGWEARIVINKKAKSKKFPITKFKEACEWREKMEEEFHREYQYSRYNKT